MEHTRDAAPVNQEETAAVREAPPTPAGSAGAVLALQRSIGNRAVGKLLREIDPRLTYTDDRDQRPPGGRAAAAIRGPELLDAVLQQGEWKASFIFARPNF